MDQFSMRTLNRKIGIKTAGDAINFLKRGLSKPKNQTILFEGSEVPRWFFIRTSEEKLWSILWALSNNLWKTITFRQKCSLWIIATPNISLDESDIKAQVWKSLLDCREKFSTLKSIIKCWVVEPVPSEWNIWIPIVSHKKEDLSLPKNYGWIMFFKIIAIMLYCYRLRKFRSWATMWF